MRAELRSWLVLLSIALAIRPAGAEERSREKFGEAFQKIREGMTTAEVEQILGKPDDVRTELDPGGIGTAGTGNVWCYGTNGHLTFPTLASIYIDRNGKVQYFTGTEGAAPLVKKVGDQELARILRLISNVHVYRNPRYLIQAVNTLQPLGKEVGCAVISEYVRIVPSTYDCWWGEDRIGHSTNLYCLVRALFKIPSESTLVENLEYPSVVRPGYFRPPALGGPSPGEPENLSSIPRFPLHIVDDVPLLIVHGYTLSGAAEPLEQHLKELESAGTWRPALLTPPADPFETVAKIKTLKGWKHSNDPYLETIINNQLREMVDTVCRCKEEDPENNDALAAEFRKLGAVWDAKSCRYTFKDGTTLHERTRKIYQRCIFRPDAGDTDAEAVLDRSSEKSVTLSLSGNFDSSRKPRPVTILVYEFEIGVTRKDPILRIQIPSQKSVDQNAGTYSTSYSKGFTLKEGTELLLVCEYENTKQSKLCKP